MKRLSVLLLAGALYAGFALIEGAFAQDVLRISEFMAGEQVRREQGAFHEPCPISPSLSVAGGEGVRRTGEGDADGFMVPMRDSMIVETSHELNPLIPAFPPAGEKVPAGRLRGIGEVAWLRYATR